MRLLFAFLALSALAIAQSADRRTLPARRDVPPPPLYEAHRAPSLLKIDGRLDEAEWQKAAPITFQFPWDAQTGAKHKTTVRLLWDDAFLYAGYQCEDADITAHLIQRDDPTYKDDAVELFVNPNPGQALNYYGFEMNARGVMFDYFMTYPRLAVLKRFNVEGFHLATTLDGTINQSADQDKGWTLEVAIPWANFSDIGSRPKVGTEWKIQLVRWDGTEPNRRLSIWSDSALESPFPHNPARFGTVRFIE